MPSRQTLVSAITAVALLLAPAAALAQSAAEAQQQLQATNQQIEDLSGKVAEHAQVAAKLEDQIANLNAQVNAVQAQINDTQAKIDALDAQIAKVQAQMAEKQAILAEAIKEQYYNPQPTTFEALVTSDSLGTFLDNREFLQKTQDKINSLLADISAIKKDLDSKKDDLKKAQDQLASQQANLDAQRQAQNDLLTQTRGEQAVYQAKLDEAAAAAQRLSSTIAKLMGTGGLPSRGYVVKGQVIGLEGSTGFSTGPHVHFGCYANQSAINPAGCVSGGRMNWPLANFVVTQGYGPASWSNSHYTFHDGYDIDAGWGAPVLAACTGNLIMDSFQADGFGHYKVIDCGGGYWALAAHMQN